MYYQQNEYLILIMITNKHDAVQLIQRGT